MLSLSLLRIERKGATPPFGGRKEREKELGGYKSILGPSLSGYGFGDRRRRRRRRKFLGCPRVSEDDSQGAV